MQTERNFKILIVDDDNLILKFYQVIFQPPRYMVATADNGEDGLKMAHEFGPDLIISDVIMPKMDGYQFCAALRSERKFDNTILLMSSSVLTEVKDAVKALEGGADDYVLKPVDEEQAKAKVDAFLRIKVLQDDLVESNTKLQETVAELQEHKTIITNQNIKLLQEKEVIKNSLREKSFLLEELEQSNKALSELNEQVKTNFDHVVAILAKIIEFRRKSNKGHAQKVSQISEQIARKMELSENAIHDIRIAALLHEIGKTAIPDKIMGLDPAERSITDQQVLEQYPITGKRLLMNHHGLEGVALIIRHILEHQDGSGFPDNLIAENIPIGSRIIKAVKDFDSLHFKNNDEESIPTIISHLKALVDEIYDDQVIRILSEIVGETYQGAPDNTDSVHISDLIEGMVLAEDLFTDSGILLIPEKTEITTGLIGSIMKYNTSDSLSDRIKINRR